MLTHLSKKTIFLVYGIPFSILIFSIFLLTGSGIHISPELGAAITYDLCLTIPIIYFLLIRKRNISKLTVVPFFILGLFTASLFIPEEQQFHLDLIKTFLLPLVEITVLGLIIYRVRKAIKAFKLHSTGQTDFLHLAQQSALELVGKEKIAHLVATEIGTIYYSFFAWKRRELQANEFTAYKKNAVSAILGAFMMLILVETFAMHFIFLKWSETFAWIIMGLSIYTIFQLFGHVRALRKRPISLESAHLHLKYGLFGEMEIPYDEIKKIEISSLHQENEEEKAEHLALLPDLEGFNIILSLKKPLTMVKAFGVTKTCDVVLVYVDEKEIFAEELGKRVNTD